MMSSKYCNSCLQSCHRSIRTLAHKPYRATLQFQISHSRAFTNTSRSATNLPEPNATVSSSIPPITPLRVKGGISTAAGLKAAAGLQKVAGRGATETYTAYGVTEKLIKDCARQADYSITQQALDEEVPKTADGEDLGVGNGWWHTELGLKPTFSTWSQVTMLHMYILSARFRCLAPEHAQVWQQHLLDHFFYTAEDKMTVAHGMHARGTRNKYLKDLFVQWRGLLVAYDEGVYKGDAVLAAAIWRNVFKGDEEVAVRSLALVVSYMRRGLRDLDELADARLERGEVRWSDPREEKMVVGERSVSLDAPVKDGDLLETKP